MSKDKRFVILSGPAGVGKGPLQAAIECFAPSLLKARPVLCTSRPPRNSEVHGRHYYFLPRGLILSLQSNPDFLVAPVRSDFQAIDMTQVEELLAASDLVFAETYPTFGPELRKRASAHGFSSSSVFLLPLPAGTACEQVAKLVEQRLTDRGTDAPEKIQERANLAPREIADAAAYTHRLLSPAGENDIEQWGEFGARHGQKGERAIRDLDDLGPVAHWLVTTFIAILRGDLPPGDYAPQML